MWALIGGIRDDCFVCFWCGAEVHGDICDDNLIENIAEHVRMHTPFQDFGYEISKLERWPRGYSLYVVAPFEVARDGGSYDPDEELKP